MDDKFFAFEKSYFMSVSLEVYVVLCLFENTLLRRLIYSWISEGYLLDITNWFKPSLAE